MTITRIRTSPDSTSTSQQTRTALSILAISVFAGVTTEMLPVGLLAQISDSYGTSESTTGLLVTLYASLVAILAVPLTMATGRLDRKRLLIGAVCTYALSNLLAALAPTFTVLAIARGLGGATHAVFFSLCIGYAARVAAPGQTGKAMAIMSAGGSAGFILGVPLATALGSAVGWRGAFGALAVLLILDMVLILRHLPAVTVSSEAHPVKRGNRRLLVAVVVSNAFVFLGHYTLYTYVSVLLVRAGASVGDVGPVLLVFGISGLIGLRIAGAKLDARPRGATVAVLSVLILGLLAVSVSYPVLGVLIVAAAVWNGAFGPVASIYQTAAVRAQATSPDLAGAWLNSMSNVGISAGAALGGAVLGAAGLRGVSWVAAAAVLVGLAIVVAATRAFPAAARPGEVPASNASVDAAVDTIDTDASADALVAADAEAPVKRSADALC